MKRHPLDLLSLLTGTVFLVVAVVYLVADVIDRTPSAQVVMPLMVMGLGIAGLVAAVQSQQRTDRALTADDQLPTEESLPLD